MIFVVFHSSLEFTFVCVLILYIVPWTITIQSTIHICTLSLHLTTFSHLKCSWQLIDSTPVDDCDKPTTEWLGLVKPLLVTFRWAWYTRRSGWLLQVARAVNCEDRGVERKTVEQRRSPHWQTASRFDERSICMTVSVTHCWESVRGRLIYIFYIQTAQVVIDTEIWNLYVDLAAVRRITCS